MASASTSEVEKLIALTALPRSDEGPSVAVPLPFVSCCPLQADSRSSDPSVTCASTVSTHHSISVPFLTAAPPSANSHSPESIAATLIGLSESKPHWYLLQDWRRGDKTLRFRIHRKEQNLSDAESHVYELLGIFSLLQGVLFGALAQTSIFRCEDWISPFFMSVLVFAVMFGAVVQKICVIAEIEKELKRAQEEAKALYLCMEKLVRHGCNYDLELLNEEPRVLPEEDHHSNLVSKLLFEYIFTRSFTVLALMIVLSVIVMSSCKEILCRGCRCQP